MTSIRASAAAPGRADADRLTSSLVASFLAPATAVAILAVALLLLMTPIWTHFALAASGGTQATATPELAYQLSDRTVSELFVGPGTFRDFGPDEAGHMRDVRLVLLAFLAAAAVALVVITWSIRRAAADSRTWRSVARGASALVISLVVAGAIAVVAFGAAFELFHRILFPGGNWTFPADSLLIRLYPYAFWQLSAAALGVLAISGGLAVWALARRRARSLEREGVA